MNMSIMLKQRFVLMKLNDFTVLCSCVIYKNIQNKAYTLFKKHYYNFLWLHIYNTV